MYSHCRTERHRSTHLQFFLGCLWPCQLFNFPRLYRQARRMATYLQVLQRMVKLGRRYPMPCRYVSYIFESVPKYIESNV